jgi:hypothetical protein
MMKRRKITMNKKIKNFICYNINQRGLECIEDEINDFTTSHNVIDIKVTFTHNNISSSVIYTVIYVEEE